MLDEAAPEEPVVLIGHSIGGMAILAFAELYPEAFGSRVAGVVLANTAAGELVKELLGGLGTRLAALATPALRRMLVTNPRPAQRLLCAAGCELKHRKTQQGGNPHLVVPPHAPTSLNLYDLVRRNPQKGPEIVY